MPVVGAVLESIGIREHLYVRRLNGEAASARSNLPTDLHERLSHFSDERVEWTSLNNLTFVLWHFAMFVRRILGALAEVAGWTQSIFKTDVRTIAGRASGREILGPRPVPNGYEGPRRDSVVPRSQVGVGKPPL
jgi:hypothetical protein